MRVCLGKNQHSLNRNQTSHTNTHTYIHVKSKEFFLYIYVNIYIAIFAITGCHQACQRHQIQHHTLFSAHTRSRIVTTTKNDSGSLPCKQPTISPTHEGGIDSNIIEIFPFQHNAKHQRIPFHSSTQVMLMMQPLLRAAAKIPL